VTPSRLTRVAVILIVAVLGVPSPVWSQGNASKIVIRALPTVAQQVATKYGLTAVGGFANANGNLHSFRIPDGQSADALVSAIALEAGVTNVEADAAFQLPAPVLLDQSTVSVLNQSTVSVLNQSTVSVLNALLDTSPVLYYGATVPNGYLQQPAMQLVNRSGAQQVAAGTGVIIALIDGGIDTQHPALQGALLPGFNFLNDSADVSAFSGLDQSTVSVLNQSTVSVLNQSTVSVLNQSTVSVLNQSTVSVLNSLPPYFGHGTEHAGVLRLVAPQSSILPLRAFQDNGTAELYNIVRAIYYAVDQGAKVISMSFSCDCQSKELAEAIRYASQRGVLLTGSVGNDASQARLFPAAYSSVMGVGASNLDDTAASFSNYGSAVFVVAPGAGVITTFPGGNYAAVWGTSFSSPQVAGQAALLLSKGITPSAIAQTIFATSTLGGTANRDKYLGFGRINLLQALLR